MVLSSRHRQQRGLTLIELMIALLVSSLLIGMVFAIYVRMSVAYRGQTEISQLQQSLRAAKRMIVRDTRSAGFLIPGGFEASDAVKGNLGLLPADIIPPVSVANNVDDGKTDRLRLYYANTSAIAKLTGTSTATTVEVDDVDNFEIGDVVVIVAAATVADNNNANLPDATGLVSYNACILKITDIVGTAPATFTFDSAAGAPYNDAILAFCAFGPPPPPPPPPPLPPTSILMHNTSMIYRFTARSYRIDPTRLESSVLQLSPTGELEDPPPGDWQDIGVGFTDLQIAYRTYEEGDGVDLDGLGDADRDWYSGTTVPPLGAEITEVNLSLTVRTTRDLNVVATSATPEFYNATFPDNNPQGDSEAVTLPDPDPRYRGNHVYRYTSVRVDLRNVGVGR